MANDDTAPADTAIMGIVHDALRRDLDRLHRVLTTDMVNSSDDARQEANCRARGVEVLLPWSTGRCPHRLTVE